MNLKKRISIHIGIIVLFTAIIVSFTYSLGIPYEYEQVGRTAGGADTTKLTYC